MDRNYLAHPQGNANNALLAAAAYNFRPLLAWLRLSLPVVLYILALSNQRACRPGPA
jgi:transposase, IS5 family